jgi:hypothetical protein
MNMFKSMKNFLTLLPLAALLFSCGGSNEGETQQADTTKSSDTIASVQVPEELIGIPAPSEMLDFVRMTSKKGSKSTTFLNSVDNLKNYKDAGSMALNFGIYSCDLSYCSIFDIGSSTKSYFEVVKTLGEEVGVSSVITPDVLKRAEANMKNPDSLMRIADEVYFSSTELLENSGKGPMLALMIAGGYIESMHVAANVMKFHPENPAVGRFADQKYVIEDVILFLQKYESNPTVAEVKKQFQGLRDEFNQITEKSVEAPQQKEGGKKVFGGGAVLVMDEAQFKSISAKVKSIRDNFAQIKS